MYSVFYHLANFHFGCLITQNIPFALLGNAGHCRYGKSQLNISHLMMPKALWLQQQKAVGSLHLLTHFIADLFICILE